MSSYLSTTIQRVRYLISKDNDDTLILEKNNGAFVKVALDTPAARDAAVTAAVNTAVTNLLAGVPGALDTLNELATALGDDPAFAVTVTTALGNRLLWRGLWAATTAYVRNDLVLFNGGLYAAPASFTSGASFVKANWTELVPQIGTYAAVLRNGDIATPMGPPNIVFDGDSLTLGTGALPFNRFPFSNDYPSQVVGGLSQLGTYYNVGVGGETVATMITNAPTVVDVKLSVASHVINIVCFSGGTNDLYFGADATTTYNRIVAYCQARQAAGWKVIVGTLTPRSDAGTPVGFDAARLTVNANIRSNWSTFADGIADNGADSSMGTSGQEGDTRFYNGDLVHHNPAGYRIKAQYFLKALSAFGVVGHHHGDRQALISDLRFTAVEMAAMSGSPTFAKVSNTPAWQLHHGFIEAIVIPDVLIPVNWLSFTTKVKYSNTTGGVGNAVLRCDLLPRTQGSNLATGVLTGAAPTVAGPTSFRDTQLDMRTDNVQNTISARTTFDIRIFRLGTNGSDTLTDTIDVLGVYLYRVS